jgi:hypothetical protein
LRRVLTFNTDSRLNDSTYLIERGAPYAGNGA